MCHPLHSFNGIIIVYSRFYFISCLIIRAVFFWVGSKVSDTPKARNTTPLVISRLAISCSVFPNSQPCLYHHSSISCYRWSFNCQIIHSANKYLHFFFLSPHGGLTCSISFPSFSLLVAIIIRSVHANCFKVFRTGLFFLFAQ